MDVNLAKQIKKKLKLLADGRLYDHIVAFAFFCGRQARRYAAQAAKWVDAAQAAAARAVEWAEWVADDAAQAAVDWAAAAVAAEEAAKVATTAADARKEQLEFLKWIWATTKQHWQTRKFKNVGGIIL
jgi:hypothetical protein